MLTDSQWWSILASVLTVIGSGIIGYASGLGPDGDE